MAKISELKNKIVELAVELRDAKIPQGHCPYAYYSNDDDVDINCNEYDCTECRQRFLKNYEERVRKQVRSW